MKCVQIMKISKDHGNFAMEIDIKPLKYRSLKGLGTLVVHTINL